MREHLPNATYSFLSSLNSQASHLGQSASTPPLPIQHSIHAPTQFLQFLDQETKNIFVLSGSKSHGQDLFQQLIRAKKDEQRLIVGENIT
jgi:precorrin-6B methylase 1